ncbi:MAG TPA: FAD-dependent oxidoreductase [Gemmatimonadales bacterium]
MSVNPDVLIIGGGVVGAACARELALAGRRIVCIEPGGQTGQGWRAAAGLLSPQVEGDEDDPLLEVGLAGREWHLTTRETLEGTTGIHLGLTLCGIASLAASANDAERLKTLVAWQRQQGLYCDWLLPDEIRHRWPWLPDSHGALFAPQDGSIDPVALVQALIQDGARLGVRRIEDRITALDVENGRLVGARGRERYQAGSVILAAGAWSGRIGNLPRPVSVEPVRGQMIALPRPSQLEEDVIVFGGHGHYLLTRGDELLAGTTMEHAGFDSVTTGEGIARVHQGAERLCGLVRGSEPLRAWAGLRPGTPDGLPIIGPEPRLEGLWYATGHGRNGVLLAGITAIVLLQMMQREATLESVAAFRPERFWNW